MRRETVRRESMKRESVKRGSKQTNHANLETHGRDSLPQGDQQLENHVSVKNRSNLRTIDAMIEVRTACRRCMLRFHYTCVHTHVCGSIYTDA